MNDDPPSAPSHAVPAQPASQILVADASPEARAALAAVAVSVLPNATIIAAVSGREACDVLASGAAEVAFVDMDFADMNGAEAVAAARKAGAQPFVILMTEQIDADRQTRSRDTDAYELLAKPLKDETVRQVLTSYARMKAPCRVLVADDSKAFRHLMRKVFAASRFGIGFDLVDNGKLAIDLLRQQAYDVIFIDYDMPGLDGIEVASLVQDVSPSTRVVMVSSTDNAPVQQAARHFGAVEFLKKPFHTTDIDRALHRALGLPLPSLLQIPGASREGRPAA